MLLGQLTKHDVGTTGESSATSLDLEEETSNWSLDLDEELDEELDEDELEDLDFLDLDFFVDFDFDFDFDIPFFRSLFSPVTSSSVKYTLIVSTTSLISLSASS